MNSFLKAILGKERISIVAEVKNYSPSFGKEFPKYDLKNLVSSYEEGGASAISVVTAHSPFRGSKEMLVDVRALTKLPILRKDFLSTADDIDESILLGANAVLLIARDLTGEILEKLCLCAQKKRLDVVIELNDDEDLSKAKSIIENKTFDNLIIGINNRNLKDFSVDVNHAFSFLNKLPTNIPVIAESAFRKPEDLARYLGKIDAVLIGTAFLISENHAQTLINFCSYARSSKQ